jgi:putative transposase
MPKPLSNDLRIRIVRSVDSGISRRATARRFEVSESAVIKLMTRWRETGTVAPGQMGGWTEATLSPHEDLVRSLVAKHPDLTLEELGAKLGEAGVQVSRTSVWRFLKACNLTLKKSRSTPQSSSGRTSRPRAKNGARARPSSIRNA